MRKIESIVFAVCFIKCKALLSVCEECVIKKAIQRTYADGENVCSSFLKRDMQAKCFFVFSFWYACVRVCVCFGRIVLSLFLLLSLNVSYIHLYLFIYFASFAARNVWCRHLLFSDMVVQLFRISANIWANIQLLISEDVCMCVLVCILFNWNSKRTRKTQRSICAAFDVATEFMIQNDEKRKKLHKHTERREKRARTMCATYLCSFQCCANLIVVALLTWLHWPNGPRMFIQWD